MPSAAIHGDTPDDTSILRRHGSLEIAALRTTVLCELRAAFAQSAVRETHDHQHLDTIVNVIDATLRHELENFIGFHVLLQERLVASAGAIDRVAISDRAALLQVRLALEASPAAGRSQSSQPPGTAASERSKARAAAGVRWSLSAGEAEYEGHEDATTTRRSVASSALALPASAPGSKLCQHAFEALRGTMDLDGSMTEQSRRSHRSRCSSLSSDGSTEPETAED